MASLHPYSAAGGHAGSAITPAPGAFAARSRARYPLGRRCPIVVRGRISGCWGAARYETEALPLETERPFAQFAELMAAAIGNADARAEVERLAEQQAALRRVATLVAEGAW